VRLKSGGLLFEANLGKYFVKLPSPKWTKGVAQAEGCQFCKFEALGSNPHPINKQINKYISK
jgi:hypothetical protein